MDVDGVKYTLLRGCPGWPVAHNWSNVTFLEMASSGTK